MEIYFRKVEILEMVEMKLFIPQMVFQGTRSNVFWFRRDDSGKSVLNQGMMCFKSEKPGSRIRTSVKYLDRNQTTLPDRTLSSQRQALSLTIQLDTGILCPASRRRPADRPAALCTAYSSKVCQMTP